MRYRQVFISYQRLDAKTALRVRQALQSLGLPVWWDEQLQLGGKWSEQIDEALDRAAAVLVLWSPSAIESDWVKHEASIAKAQGRLAQARISDCGIPDVFAPHQSATLIDWQGDERDHRFQTLAHHIRKLIRRRLLLDALRLAIPLVAVVSSALAIYLVVNQRPAVLLPPGEQISFSTSFVFSKSLAARAVRNRDRGWDRDCKAAGGGALQEMGFKLVEVENEVAV